MTAAPPDDGLITVIDHVAACLPAGELDATVSFYHSVFGLDQIYDERIEVGGQAMLSKVMQGHSGAVTFTLIEPDSAGNPARSTSSEGARRRGVQHLALHQRHRGRYPGDVRPRVEF
jgi:4-hydroxymandelate synthase